MNVHNHGPEEGKGLACREHLVAPIIQSAIEEGIAHAVVTNSAATAGEPSESSRDLCRRLHGQSKPAATEPRKAAPPCATPVYDVGEQGAERAQELWSSIEKKLHYFPSAEKRRDAVLLLTAALSQRHGDSVEIDEAEGFRIALGKAIDFAEWGWTIIANANGGNWETASKDWQEAAAKYRDQFHNEIRFLAGVPQDERGDSAECAVCGEALQLVRPGKWQHIGECHGDSAERDWPEDYADENGRYRNKCCICGHEFTGHKHRVTCKICSRGDSATAGQEAFSEGRESVLSYPNTDTTRLEAMIDNGWQVWTHKKGWEVWDRNENIIGESVTGPRGAIDAAVNATLPPSAERKETNG